MLLLPHCLCNCLSISISRINFQPVDSSVNDFSHFFSLPLRVFHQFLHIHVFSLYENTGDATSCIPLVVIGSAALWGVQPVDSLVLCITRVAFMKHNTLEIQSEWIARELNEELVIMEFIFLFFDHRESYNFRWGIMARVRH